MSEKLYPELGLHRTLVFACNKCEYEVEGSNGTYKEYIGTCPKCNSGEVVEKKVPCTNFKNNSRERDWMQSASIIDQAKVYGGDSDPY